MSRKHLVPSAGFWFNAARRERLVRPWAIRRRGRLAFCRKSIGRATRKAHNSGARTAKVLGATSHPNKIKTSNTMRRNVSGPPC